MAEEILHFKYTFSFSENLYRTFELEVDPITLMALKSDDDKPINWAKLDYFKCPNCPLDESKNEYCPLAIKCYPIINFFNSFPSTQTANIIIETNERIVYKYTSVQMGVSSLFGLIMTTSGCPMLGKLRPMVESHLPFSTLDETEYRVFSMYIFLQYLKMMKNETPDWNFSGLRKLYEDIEIVNRNIIEKLNHIEMNDTSRNAAVGLNSFAQYILAILDDNEIEKYYERLIPLNSET